MARKPYIAIIRDNTNPEGYRFAWAFMGSETPEGAVDKAFEQLREQFPNILIGQSFEIEVKPIDIAEIHKLLAYLHSDAAAGNEAEDAAGDYGILSAELIEGVM